MQALLKPCQSCNKPMNGGVYRAAHICPHCLFQHEGAKSRKPKLKAVKRQPDIQVEEVSSDAFSGEAEPAVAVKRDYEAPSSASEVELTADPVDKANVATVFGEQSFESVLKIELTPDLFKEGKFIGSKSEKVKAAVKQGRKHTLAQLRDAAFKAGANYVTDVAVKSGIKTVGSKTANITVRATGQIFCVNNAEAEA